MISDYVMIYESNLDSILISKYQEIEEKLIEINSDIETLIGTQYEWSGSGRDTFDQIIEKMKEYQSNLIEKNPLILTSLNELKSNFDEYADYSRYFDGIEF